MEEIRKRELEEYIQSMMKNKHIPGLAMAISQSGNIVYKKGFGYRDTDGQEPVTPDTIFGTASITKSFTAMAILKLEEEGKLSVNDAVIKYLPGWKLLNHPVMEEIKISHLLSHTTGVPPMRRREELNEFQQHITYFHQEQIELLGEPGEYFSYCNDTFLLLGAIIEQVTGKGFRTYITENILSPLKMNRSTMSLEKLSTFENVSVPYEYNKNTKNFEPQEWPTLGNYEVGGGIRSNVLDLLKYGEPYVGESTILSKSQIRNMWQPVIRVHGETHYGYALTSTPYPYGFTLVGHGGGQAGVSSYFGFVPEKKLVVSVLMNVSGGPSFDIWLAGVHAALNLPMEEMGHKEIDYLGAWDERIIGDYNSSEGGTITITSEQTILVEGESYCLHQTGEKTFFIEEIQTPLRFYYKKESQHPWAVLFGFRMLRRSF